MKTNLPDDLAKHARRIGTVRANHRPAAAEGELCTLCGSPAYTKVAEEVFSDDPVPYRHGLSSYLCAEHFAAVMGLRKVPK